MTSVWEKPPPRTARAPLDRTRIVRAATALADAEGLDAVSMRRVAAALDAGPMRLYTHVATKSELLELMVDAVYGELAAEVEPTPGWRAALLGVGRATWRAAERHPWLVDLLGGRPQLGPHALAVLEVSAAAVAAVPGAGGPDRDRADLAVLNAYMTGAVRQAVGEREAAARSGLDKPSWQSATGPYLRRVLADGQHPALARLVELAVEVEPREAYERGLEQVLDGIAASRSQSATV